MTQAVRRISDPGSGFMTLSTDTVLIGSHTLPAEHREWSLVRTFSASPIVAFARTPIEVTIGLDPPAMLTGAVAATPPGGADYVRTPRTSAGQHAVWCQILDPRTTAEIVSRFDASAIDRVEAPFRRSVSPSHPVAALAAERLAHAARAGHHPDPLELDEAVIRITEAVASQSGPEFPPPRRAGSETHRQRMQAVSAACEFMAIRFDRPISIADIAEATAYSPAFLSRCFRAALGHSMHDHLVRIRLREALQLLADHRLTIARVAAATGFASHAHLSATFRERLGLTPSALARASRRSVRELVALL